MTDEAKLVQSSDPISLYSLLESFFRFEGNKDPPALSIPCPICEAEAGVWCGFLRCDIGRIGIVHKAREEHLTT